MKKVYGLSDDYLLGMLWQDEDWVFCLKKISSYIIIILRIHSYAINIFRLMY